MALILAGGALWLFLASSVFADGGPHIAAVNSGSLGLTSDNCAGCHRAHTAQGADLLKVDQGTLCLSCHNGNGSTVDVVDGLQYVPDAGTAPNNPIHTGNTVLGALRGGGFSYALMSANQGSRKNYLSQTQSLAFSGYANGDTFTLTVIDGHGTVATGDDTPYTTAAIAYSTTGATLATNIQNALRALPAGVAKIVYSLNGYTSAQTTVQSFSASWSSSTSTVNVSYAGYMAYVANKQPLMTWTNGTGTGTIAVTQSSSQVALRALPRVGVVAAAAKQPVTSTHKGGTDVVWGNGAIAMGTGVALAGTSELECASCHNPHGNGAYRILRTDPGEDWITEGTPTFDNGAAVSVPDITKKVDTTTTLDPTVDIRNYTVQPYTTAAEVIAAGYGALAGDYVRRNVPAWYYSGSADFDTSGWAQDPTKPNVTTWCIQCHTRYNGITTNGSPSSLTSPSNGADSHFNFKHGTERVGCLMCHVSHGSSAEMIGSDSANYTNPDGNAQLVYRLAATPGTFLRTDSVQIGGVAPAGTAGTNYRIEGDSRLLKADNRGTCQLCHDPTGTSSTDPTGNANVSGYLPSPLYP